MNSTNKKKITIRFFLYILGGAALGACLCFGILYVETPFTKLVTDFYTGLLAYAPWITMPIGLAAILFSYVPLAKAKKRIADWNGWNDDTDDTFYRQTERLLNVSLRISILGSMVLFMAIALLTIATYGKHMSVYLFFVCMLCFLFCMIFLAFLQRKAVEQLRILNPEKKGDALELHFRKKWMESLDEQERLATYAASYKAFSSLNIVFFVLYILMILLVPFFSIGFLPFLCVGCMWLIPYGVYLLTVCKEKSVQ